MEKEKKPSRHSTRRVAMINLCLYDFYNNTIQKIDDHLGEEHPYDPKFYGAIFEYAYNNLEKIDKTIEGHIENYSINRLNVVDRAIIRLAVAEFYMGTPHNIVIDEALNLTKEFSDEGNAKAKSFNNKLLDKISKSFE